MKEKITIYLADDHRIVIDGIMLLLKDEDSLIVCGSAGDGQKASEDILSLKPDIALIDMRMPEKDGIQLIRSIGSRVKTRFIFLSMYSERRYIQDAQQYGASGYLLKNTGKEELLKCIFAVAAGGTYFSEPTREKNSLLLTNREVEILKCVLNEMTTLQIAEKLFLSHFTVETHRKNIARKTGAKNMAGLLRYAMENDIAIREV